MVTKQIYNRGLTALALCLLALPAAAQSFRVQCPSSTQHPQPGGEVKCQQISGGDGFATMGDGTQTYIFSFGPLSGLQDIKRGMPGTQTADVFNQPYVGDPNNPNDPDAALSNPNGAVGLAPDPAAATMPDGSRNSALATACAGTAPPTACFTGHVDPRTIMDVGVSCNAPALYTVLTPSNRRRNSARAAGANVRASPLSCRQVQSLFDMSTSAARFCVKNRSMVPLGPNNRPKSAKGTSRSLPRVNG